MKKNSWFFLGLLLFFILLFAAFKFNYYFNYSAANFFLSIKSYKLAATFLYRCLDLNPKFTPGYYLLGESLFKQNDYLAAKEQYDKFIERTAKLNKNLILNLQQKYIYFSEYFLKKDLLEELKSSYKTTKNLKVENKQLTKIYNLLLSKLFKNLRENNFANFYKLFLISKEINLPKEQFKKINVSLEKNFQENIFKNPAQAEKLLQLQILIIPQEKKKITLMKKDLAFAFLFKAYTQKEEDKFQNNLKKANNILSEVSNFKKNKITNNEKLLFPLKPILTNYWEDKNLISESSSATKVTLPLNNILDYELINKNNILIHSKEKSYIVNITTKNIILALKNQFNLKPLALQNGIIYIEKQLNKDKNLITLNTFNLQTKQKSFFSLPAIPRLWQVFKNKNKIALWLNNDIYIFDTKNQWLWKEFTPQCQLNSLYLSNSLVLYSCNFSKATYYKTSLYTYNLNSKKNVNTENQVKLGNLNCEALENNKFFCYLTFSNLIRFLLIADNKKVVSSNFYFNVNHSPYFSCSGNVKSCIFYTVEKNSFEKKYFNFNLKNYVVFNSPKIFFLKNKPYFIIQDTNNIFFLINISESNFFTKENNFNYYQLASSRSKKENIKYLADDNSFYFMQNINSNSSAIYKQNIVYLKPSENKSQKYLKLVKRLNIFNDNTVLTLRDAIRLNPKNLKAHSLLAEIYYKLALKEKNIIKKNIFLDGSLFETRFLLTQNPQDAVALNFLKKVLLEKINL